VIHFYGKYSGVHTFPYIESKNYSAKIEHEATTSSRKIKFSIATNEDLTEKGCIEMSFSKEVLNKLPMNLRKRRSYLRFRLNVWQDSQKIKAMDIVLKNVKKRFSSFKVIIKSLGFEIVEEENHTILNL
jgi:enoyl-[acyl-carrier-protein] reductase (NADH)